MSLDFLFEKLRREFFKGKLRGYRVKWANLPENIRGLNDEKTKTIKIRRGLRGDYLRGALLHEMVHSIAGAGHGKRFEAEVARLVKLGEDREAITARSMEEKGVIQAARAPGAPPWEQASKWFTSCAGVKQSEDIPAWVKNLYEHERAKVQRARRR